MAQKTIAAYVRVSTKDQNFAAQQPDLERWLERNNIQPENVGWYYDKESGTTLKRPEMQRLMNDIRTGRIHTVVFWKMDRMTRKMRDGISLLSDWCDRGCRVVSVTEQFDFSGVIGKMIASMLFAFAELEHQHRSERVKAGLSAARNKYCPKCKKERKPYMKAKNRIFYKCKECGETWQGKYFGGRPKGTFHRLNAEMRESAITLYQNGKSAFFIGRSMGVSRQTIYRALREAGVFQGESAEKPV